jgi:hypothetical protein
MDDDLDYTMSIPLPTLPTELPEGLEARIEAAIAALQAQLGEDEAKAEGGLR